MTQRQVVGEFPLRLFSGQIDAVINLDGGFEIACEVVKETAELD